MSWNTKDIRKEFPALTQEVNGHPLVYLDSAATTLKPRKVIERIHQYYSLETANVHRGAHTLSQRGTDAFEAAREFVKEFIGAESVDEVIFTRGTTESINLVAHSLGHEHLNPGDEIVLSEMEHHSNIVPWQMVAEKKGCVIRVVPVTEQGELDMGAYRQLLGPKTKIVSLVWCSNTLGTVNDIKSCVQQAHSVGAMVMVDAAQAVSHLRTNVRELDCDFLAFSGHKVFGPTGIGVLFGKKKWLDQMPPYQGGGSMISQVSFDGTTYNAPPFRFEAGTPHIAGVIGLATALEFVNELGLDAIRSHDAEITLTALEALRSVPGLTLYGPDRERNAVFSFNLQGLHASDVGHLLDQQGVAVRAGHHCTQPLMKRLGVPATARAAFSVYNSIEEINRLVETLHKVREFA